jgi:ankyrin repeat protein
VDEGVDLNDPDRPILNHIFNDTLNRARYFEMTDFYDRSYALTDFLLQAGADPNIENMGQSVLQRTSSLLATRPLLRSFVALLLNYSADPNHSSLIAIQGQQPYYYTDFYVIIKSEHVELVQQAIDHGANIHIVAREFNGPTVISALEEAVLTASRQLVTIIINAGATQEEGQKAYELIQRIYAGQAEFNLEVDFGIYPFGYTEQQLSDAVDEAIQMKAAEIANVLRPRKLL